MADLCSNRCKWHMTSWTVKPNCRRHQLRNCVFLRFMIWLVQLMCVIPSWFNNVILTPQVSLPRNWNIQNSPAPYSSSGISEDFPNHFTTLDMLTFPAASPNFHKFPRILQPIININQPIHPSAPGHSSGWLQLFRWRSNTINGCPDVGASLVEGGS